jgi:hypothetical protein
MSWSKETVMKDYRGRDRKLYKRKHGQRMDKGLLRVYRDLGFRKNRRKSS